MNKRYIVKFSDIPIEVQSDVGYLKDFFRSYLTDEEPLFQVNTTPEAVETEVKNASGPTTYEYAEALCLYREIAERLPLLDRAVFHGAAIEYGGKAYLFTAPSGTGKTTHIALWRRYLGEKVDIINGDKPILRLTPDGFIAYGTPYAGKEGWQRNVSAPLAGICILSQGKENRIGRAEDGLYMSLLNQIYRPNDKEAMRRTAALVRELCRVPCWRFSCDMSQEAVRTSFEALTNEKYEAKQ